MAERCGQNDMILTPRDLLSHIILPEMCCALLRLEDWVAGAGLSEAKEAPGFRAIALQPRPRTNQNLTMH